MSRIKLLSRDLKDTGEREDELSPIEQVPALISAMRGQLIMEAYQVRTRGRIRCSKHQHEQVVAVETINLEIRI
jgi:hypothetical protein